MRYWMPFIACLMILATPPAAAHEEYEDEANHPVPKHEQKHEHRSKQHKHRRHHRNHEPRQGRAWIGLGVGVAYASVDVPCSGSSFGSDCTEEGDLRTYSANFTASGPRAAVRVRGIRDQDKGNDERTPYETAALVGTRFGRSNWYGLIGAGRIRHADDEFQGDANGFAWEILFAPSSDGAGLELSFQGHSGREVDFAGFNLGMRFGALR